MTTEEALHIISYKTALKKSPEEALTDPVLLPISIQKAITDQQNGIGEIIPAKDYMAATKIIREHRIQLFKQQNENYLTENQKRPEIQTTSSGLQYQIHKAGQGPSPTSESKVTVHYHGTLTDGTIFDTTERKKPPVDHVVKTFELKKVIPGWREGVLLMSPGATHTLYIPQNLAYGDRDLPNNIPPHATLIIKVTLIKVD